MIFEKYDIIVVGGGLSGIVMAEQFSRRGKKILIIDKRDHIGGNCYDYHDEKTGILMNKYGAHLFHTNDEEVFSYIKQFCKWEKWEHKVLGLIDDQYLPIPPNITTVNKIFNLNIETEEEMNEWLEKNQIKYEKIKNGEEMAKSRVGEVLYDKIFKHYTYKQWKKYPENLAPEVLARIPVRNSFDDRYFSDKYQVLPEKGYTAFFQSILDKHKENIDVKLNVDFFDIKDKITKEQIVIYTGPIDAYFADKGLPKLEYRSIDFHIEHKMNTYLNQPYSVVNYPGPDTPYTRCVEYKHFLNQKSKHTVYVKETTTDLGEPYYPVLNDRNKELYAKYQKMAEEEGNNIHFIGRLASYKYFNMDQAIKNSLDYYKEHFEKRILICRILGNDIPNLHGFNQTLINLEFTLKNESNFPQTDKIYVLNRIYNLENKVNIISLLKKYNQKYLDIPFSIEEYNKLPNIKDIDSKTSLPLLMKNTYKYNRNHNLYIVNNNGARNFSIEYGREKGYLYTFPLDSNAFFLHSDYLSILDKINNNDYEYIIVKQKRLSECGILSNEIIYDEDILKKLPDREPQIGFKKTAPLLFNELIPYGFMDKGELLNAIKVKGVWNNWKELKHINIDNRSVNTTFIEIGKIYRLNNFIKKYNVKNNPKLRQYGIIEYDKEIQNLYPKISIILTTYNVGDYVDQTLSSIINQTYKNLEIIVVDDCSTDQTEEIILKYYKKYKNIIYKKFHHRTCGGCCNTSNLGLETASGEYIIFVDGDDYIKKNMVEILVKSILKSESDIVICNYYEDINGKIQNAYHEQIYQSVCKKYNKYDVFLTSPVPWNKIYKNSFLKKNKIKFISGDYFFENNPWHWLNLINTDKVKFIPNKLIYHRKETEREQTTSNFKKLNNFNLTYFFTVFYNIREIIKKKTFEFNRIFMKWLNRHKFLKCIMKHDSKLNVKVVRILNNFIGHKSTYTKDLTIIIPVYKVDNYTFLNKLTLTLSKYNNIEIIFINDNPGQNKELELYYQKYNNVYLIENDKNIGAGGSRNRAIPIIEGKYSYFFDADDSINIDLFLKELNILNKNDYDILFFKYYFNCKKVDNLELNYDNLKENKINFLKLSTYPWSFIVKSSVIHNNSIFFGVTNIQNDINYFILATYYSNKQYFSKNYIYYYVRDRNNNCLSNYKDRSNSIHSVYHTYLKLKEIGYPYLVRYEILINKVINWTITKDKKNKKKILEFKQLYFHKDKQQRDDFEKDYICDTNSNNLNKALNLTNKKEKINNIFNSTKVNITQKFHDETEFYFYIRGHIRESFETERLNNFVKLLKLYFPNIKFILQTWKKNQCKNGESWKIIKPYHMIINNSVILNYFQNNIVTQNCLIIDEYTIKLIGSTEGNIGKSLCPKKGWKNIWYGKLKGIQNIKDSQDKLLVCFRFDFFDIQQSKNCKEQKIIEFIKQNINTSKIKFLFKETEEGVDNCYMGKLKNIKTLMERFNFKLDKILNQYNNITHQEFLIPMICKKYNL